MGRAPLPVSCLPCLRGDEALNAINPGASDTSVEFYEVPVQMVS